MSRGYLCIVQDTHYVDYLRCAYGLALSLHLTQNEIRNISICVDARTKERIKAKHRRVFDHIIDIPWGDSAPEDSDWRIHNKWKYLHMTPYDETVVLDADMLFPTGVDHWWDIMSERDMWFTSHVKTYRGEDVTCDYYRRYFTANSLPNLYTAFFYFKKSALASEVFAMTEIVFQHWQRFFYKYMPKGKPDYLSGDVAYALAVQLLGVEHLVTKDNVSAMPTFVHMKSHVQESGKMPEDWTKMLPTFYSSHANFKIGNYRQTLPFHYVQKEWLTNEMISQMEQELYGR